MTPYELKKKALLESGHKLWTVENNVENWVREILCVGNKKVFFKEGSNEVTWSIKSFVECYRPVDPCTEKIVGGEVVE